MKRFEIGKEYTSESGIKAVKIHSRTACFTYASLKGQLGWYTPIRFKVRTNESTEYIVDTLGSLYFASHPLCRSERQSYF